MNHLQNPSYNPNQMLDWMINDVLKLKNDAALARKLNVSAPVLSKIRHKRLPVGDTILVRLHELTDLPTKEIKAMMGVGHNVPDEV